MRTLLIGAVLAVSPPLASRATAHPGRLDASGCHTNNKTGDYHCHRASSGQSAAAQRLSSGAVSYSNCTEARAAGAAPIHRGEPGYASKLDRDNDGVACE